MKRLIDEKGRILGKLNVIDFLIFFIVLILIPGFYLGQKLMREFYSGVEWYSRDDYAIFYGVERKCPNCEGIVTIRIKKGTPARDVFPYTMNCYLCKNEVTLKF